MREIATNITLSVSHAVEILAATIIGISILLVAWKYILGLTTTAKRLSQEDIRIHFGSTVAVALELLLGADALATAVAPTWNDIGKLAAIAVIRTGLNYVLAKELKHVKSVS